MAEAAVAEEEEEDAAAPRPVGGAAAPPAGGRPAPPLQQPAALDCSTRAVIAMLCSVVGALPGSPKAERSASAGGSPAQEAEAKVLPARFLISLFSLDIFAWGTGKLFQYEVLRLAEELGWCYVVAALVMTTAEISVEFIASSMTPRLYSWVQGTNMVRSKQLAIFALKTYWLSNLFALLVYPWFGIAIYWYGMLSPALVIALGVLRTVQYAFFNQVGDTSVELARPHLLATFQGVRLAFPGYGCCRLVRDTTVPTLAKYITLQRYAVFVPLATVYVLVGRNDIARWTLVGVLLIFNALAPSLLLYRCRELTAGIVEEPIEEEEKPQQPSLLGLCDLQLSEYSWIFFLAIFKGLPPQSAEALQSVILMELPGVAVFVMIAVIAVLNFSLLIGMICRARPAAEVQAAKKEGGFAPSESVVPCANGAFAKRWLLPVSFVLVFLTGGSAAIFTGGVVALYLVMAVLVPIAPLGKVVDIEIDKFLMRYDASRASSLVFWAQVLRVLVNGPLLAANWLAVETAGCTDEEEAEVKAAAVVLFVAVGGLAIMVLHYALIDWQLPKRASLAALVNSAVGR